MLSHKTLTHKKLIDAIILKIASREGDPYALGYLKGLTRDLIGLSDLEALELLQKAYRSIELDYRT